DERPGADPAPQGRTPRFRMFRMMPGFLSDPLIPDTPDDPALANDPVARAFLDPSDGPNWLQVALRHDHPYFDLRRPGDPGGVGFYRLYSQMQLLEAGTTSLCLNLQAVTPAGLQSGGVQDGPTVLTPGLAVFQELGGGSALQGFVGQDIWTHRAG